VLKRLFSITNIMFAAVLAISLIPGKRTGSQDVQIYTAGIVIFTYVVFLVNSMLCKDKVRKQSMADIAAIVFGFIVFWDVITAKLDIMENMLFPMPGQIVATFIAEIPAFIEGLVSSIKLLSVGYVLALALAVPLALLIGWRTRLFRAVNPLTKVLGPIPPIVYIPYAIALLPNFTSASIFIIFIGAFWPIFINTLNGTFNVDRKYIDTAKVLNVNENTMLFRIILPAIMPSIISGATIGLVLSFILLTAAEMIGASSGLGWYVKYFSDFADYPKVVTGIIFIGIVVTGITYFFDKIEKRLLIWKS